MRLLVAFLSAGRTVLVIRQVSKCAGQSRGTVSPGTVAVPEGQYSELVANYRGFKSQFLEDDIARADSGNTGEG